MADDSERLLNLSRVIESKPPIPHSSAEIPKVIDQTVAEEYAIYQGDCVQVMAGIPTDSIHFSCFSPPFASLFSYTDAQHDMSNVRDYAEFFAGFDFMVAEMRRILMPGRLVAIHCMQIPAMKERDGYIGLKDFRGDLIRAFEKHDFIYHSEVAIWKDPLIEATRTKSLGLMHKQLVKDSAMCRVGGPDYLVVMRKDGNNPEPVSHKPSGFDRWIGPEDREPKAEKKADPGKNKYSHEVWQRYASPVWSDINPSDTLQRNSIRDEDDSRHICPLQLTVIRRAIELWSNPGDVVFSPFAGIGSEGYVAIEERRRYVGVELKDTYYRQACSNLDAAMKLRDQGTLYGFGD
jgi:DNA modification methylase